MAATGMDVPFNNLADLSLDEADLAESDSSSSTDMSDNEAERGEQEEAGRGADEAMVDEGISLSDGTSPTVDFLKSLPYEVAIYVLLFADVPTLARARAVSKSWNEVCSDNLVWRDHFYRRKGWQVRPELLRTVEDGDMFSQSIGDSFPQISPSAGIAQRIGRRLSHFLPDFQSRQLTSTVALTPERHRTPNRTVSDYLPGLGHPSQSTPIRPRAETVSSTLSSLTQTRSVFRQPATPDNANERQANNTFASPFGAFGRRSSSFLSPFGPIPSPYHKATPSAPLSGLNWAKLYKTREILDKRWNSARQKTKILRGHLDSVYCIQADRHKLISGGRDHTVRVWDAKTGRCRHIFEAHDASVLCLQFDERQLITGSSDATIKVWDVHSFRLERTLRGHHSGVLDCRMNDQYIVSCSKDHSIRVWLRDHDYPLRTMTGHWGPVNAIRLQGDRIVSASSDCSVKLWDIPTGECIRVFQGHTRGLACLAWSGNKIASGSSDHTIRIWDVNTGVCLQILTGHSDLVRSLSFDNGATRLASGSYDKTVRLWDPETGEQLIEFRKGHSSLVLAVEINVSRLISCSHDKRIVVLDFGRHLEQVSPSFEFS